MWDKQETCSGLNKSMPWGVGGGEGADKKWKFRFKKRLQK